MSRKHLTKITRRDFYDFGGFENSDLCRIHTGRRWCYYTGCL